VRLAALGILLGGHLLAAAWVPVDEASAEVPLCRVIVEVEPDRAVVGQQILYRLRILRRRDVIRLDWEGNLSFPGFRAEWLPGISRGDSVDRQGESYRVFEERRALFPVRSGTLELPSAGLHCATADAQERVRIPAARVEVTELPAASQPSGFSGLVGPVEAAVTVTPRSVALGETVRISVLIQGPANVWEAGSPLSDAFSLPDAELFGKPRALARDAGRQLSLRRYFNYDLVPRREGTLRIPEIRIPYYDPKTRGFDHVVLPGSEIRVTPAATGIADTGQGRSASGARLESEEGEAGSGGLGALELATALAAATAVLGFGLLRRWRSARAGPWPEIRSGLDRAEAARSDGENAAASGLLARALRLALATRVPGAIALSAEEIFERAEDDATREVAARLRRIDRERFQPQAAPPEIGTLRSALEELRRSRG
jgi:hypothetical protein